MSEKKRRGGVDVSMGGDEGQGIAPGKRSRTSGMVQARGRTAGAAAPRSALDEAIRYLEERASELLGEGRAGPRETHAADRVADVASAADMVSDALDADEGELVEDSRRALRHAIERVAEVGRVADAKQLPALRAARDRLTRTAAGRGFDVRAPMASAADSAPLAGEADDSKLLDGLEQRIAQLVEALGAHAETPGFTDTLRSTAASIAALLAQAEGVVRGADTRDMERFSRQVLRIQVHVDLLYRRARAAHVTLGDTPLVEVFELERRLLLAVGAETGNRARSFHGEQRAVESDPASSGEALIDSIVAGFTSHAAVEQSALAVVAATLQAPEATPAPDLLQQVLVSVITDFIGGLPGHFGRLLEKVAQMADGSRTDASGSSPSTSPFTTGLFNTAKKIVGFGTGELKTEAKGAFKSSDRPTGAEMKLMFIEQAHRQTIAYMSGPLLRNARQMIPHLQRVPPAQLVALNEDMSNGLRELYSTLIEDLLAQWLNFRAGVSLGGVNEDGDLVMDGRLDEIIERPGTIKIALAVSGAGAGVVATGIEANGISPAVRKRLAEADRRLTELPVHRFVHVSGPATAGGRVPYGEIYVNAAGEIRIDRIIDRRAVALLGAPEGTSPWIVLAEPSDEEVMRGAATVLRQVTATTKDLP